MNDRLGAESKYNTVKTKGQVSSWDKSGGNLITVRVAVGIEVTGAWRRLLQGTGEPTVLMIREKSKG